MLFYEVEPALREGKKIKLDKWDNAYWYRNQDGKLMNHDENGKESSTKAIHPIILMAWLTADTWEIVDDQKAAEPAAAPVPNFSFSVALDYLKEGKKVAR